MFIFFAHNLQVEIGFKVLPTVLNMLKLVLAKTELLGRGEVER